MNRLQRIIALFLILCSFLSSTPKNAIAEYSPNSTEELEAEIAAQLAKELGEENYNIEVKAYYVSKEYLEDIAFRDRKTNWFGYYLSDIDITMEGKKWVFTTINGETAVKVFEAYDDTYDIALRNIAIGTGVIVVCVTVSALTGGIAPAISAIFAVSAKTATIYGISSGAISGVISGVSTAVKTDGDLDATLKEAARVGSSSFMWGAVTGAAIGGATEAAALYSATSSGLTMNEVAQLQKSTGWSLETISEIKSMQEAAIYQNAGLKEVVVNNRTILMREIDLNFKSTLQDGTVVTNLQRMRLGYAPIEPGTGMPLQLHHVNQNPNGILAMLTTAEHQPNASILNTAGKEGVQALLGSKWTVQKKDIWINIAKMYGG